MKRQILGSTDAICDISETLPSLNYAEQIYIFSLKSYSYHQLNKYILVGFSLIC